MQYSKFVNENTIPNKERGGEAMKNKIIAVTLALVVTAGSIPFTDKSDPEKIKETFGISKNAFKRAVGRLFKEHKIQIKEKGIELSKK